MKKLRLIIPVLCLMMACSSGTTESAEVKDLSPEQIEALEASTEALDGAIESASSAIDSLEMEVDSLLNEI